MTTAATKMEELNIPKLISFLTTSFRQCDFDMAESILLSREADLKRTTSDQLFLKQLELDALKEDYQLSKFNEANAHDRIHRLLEVQKEANSCREKYIQATADNRQLLNKCQHLESRVLELEQENSRLKNKKIENEEEYRKRIIEISDSEDDHSPSGGAFVSSGLQKVLASTLKRKGGSRVIATDSDDDDDDVPIGKLRRVGEQGKEVVKNESTVNYGETGLEKNWAMSSLTPKRKCFSRVVTSDGEDDNTPIGERKMRSVKGVKSLNDCSSVSRRRLFPLRECSGMKPGNCVTSATHSVVQNILPPNTETVISQKRTSACRKLGYSGNGDAEAEEVNGGKEADDLWSGSEGDSLGGFIVNDSHSEECEFSSNSNREEFGSDVDLSDVFGRIGRKKNRSKWEFEADMLASFAKDPQLCMKAVCALYRQQTSTEQSVKGTIVANSRGFNTIDAFKGSMIAEFLLDGDPHGSLKRSVQELDKCYPNGLEYCRKLADRYSKQLFTIYQQREDPFFFPS